MFSLRDMNACRQSGPCGCLAKSIEARGFKPYCMVRPQPPPSEPNLPNSFAYLALFAWPAVCVVLFVLLPVELAAIWSLLGGYLLLPSATSVNVALLPEFDKFSIPVIATFLLCWMKGTRSPPPARSPWVYGLAIAFVLSPILTSFTNSYELQIGDRSLPGFYPLDGVKGALNNLVTLAPFFIGMRFISSEKGREQLLRAIPIAALFYSIPMLFEVRMSPQLHKMVYGFFPHSFAQQVRDGGFRPVVFLGHGLEAALFAAIAVIAAAVAARAKWHLLRIPAGVVTAYLSVILLFCKTMGAAVYALVLVPIILFRAPKTWVNVACGATLLVCAYPLLRTFSLIPVEHIASAAKTISVDRAGSFEVRVKNEKALLAKANEKPFLGWGSWGRNRVHDENGADITITDGKWIIQFGMFGWLGYLSLFGIFAAAVMQARVGVRGPVTRARIVLAGLTLLLAANLIDLLPNSSLLPLTYLMAGSIAGCIRASVGRRSVRRRVNNSQAAVVAQ